MKQLKLEVGNTYLSREGEEVRIVRKDSGGRCPCYGNNGESYTESGRWDNSGIADPKDLIAELPETRHTFDIPDGVKKVTVEQLGNRIVVEMVPEEGEPKPGDVPEESEGPKPGDVMINKQGIVYILKEVVGNNTHKYYAGLGGVGHLSIVAYCTPGRPATPEEAQPLFDALKKAGKRWNAETMQVEDVPERDRIREWVEEHLNDGRYTHKGLAQVIEAYLNYKEGGK